MSCEYVSVFSSDSHSNEFTAYTEITNDWREFKFPSPLFNLEDSWIENSQFNHQEISNLVKPVDEQTSCKINSKKRSEAKKKVFKEAYMDANTNPIKKSSKLTPLTRPNLSKIVVGVFKDWLYNHKDNPYPTTQEKLELTRKTGVNLEVLNNWFVNNRRRLLKGILGMNCYEKFLARKNDDLIGFGVRLP